MSGKYRQILKILIQYKIKSKKEFNTFLRYYTTVSQSFSEQLQFELQSIPYQGKTHFELQLIPTYPLSHACNEIRREHV